MKPYLISVSGLLFLNFIFSACHYNHPDLHEISYGNNKNSVNFIMENGRKIYFEVYGEGEPLLLIHGNGGNIAYLKPQIEYFVHNKGLLLRLLVHLNQQHLVCHIPCGLHKGHCPSILLHTKSNIL